MRPLSRPRQALNIASAVACGIVVVLVCALGAEARPAPLVICDVFGKQHCADALARAAYRYFVRTGKDWSPWECKP